MNESESRIEGIFHEALNYDLAERGEFVAKACEGDEDLQREVLRFLDAHDDAGTYFEPLFSQKINENLNLKPETAGEHIGPYKLVEQIGQGGFGTVWVANQERPVRRRVALKIIKMGMDTKEVIARFEQERQALAIMDHPHIAKVFDAGTTEWGRPFFVMELVRGMKLTEYCDAKELSTEQRVALFIHVCQAVQHAHQKGIIHRDLKPSNILVTMVDGEAVPKVIDFGVAKALQGKLCAQTVYTQLEQMIGTPLYMSPEQAEMTSQDIDTRSDIYSLGVLLYELLTGRTPIDEKTLADVGRDEIRRVIREIDPPRPSLRVKALCAADRTTTAKRRHVDPDKLPTLLRGDLDWIVMKCLEKDRRRRYETANDLARDLRRHLEGEPILARPPTFGYLLARLFKRHRLAFVSSALIAFAIVAALVVVSVAIVRIAKERTDKDIAFRERGIALENASKRESEAQESLVRALKDEARARLFSRRMGQRFDALSAISAAARISPDDEMRDIAIASMTLPDLRRGVSWAVPQLGGRMCYDGRYRRYAFTDRQGNVSVRTIPEGNEIWKIATGPQNLATALSPDGNFLVVLGANRRLFTWRIADGRLVISDAPEQCIAIDFTANCRELAVVQSDQILRFDLVSGREINRWKIHAGGCYLDFDAAGGKLAVGYSSSSAISICDVAAGVILADLPVGPMDNQIVTWHPDGDHVAVGGSNWKIQIWDWASKQQIALLKGHVQSVTALSFHPDGGILASYSWDGTLRLWEPWSGRELLQATTEANVHFSIDGGAVGVAWESEDRVQLLEVAASREFRSLPINILPEKGANYEGDISSDGRFLALGMGDGVRLWELTTGRQVSYLPMGDSRSVLFGPDSQQLWTGTLGENVLQEWSLKEVANREIHITRRDLFKLPAGSAMRMRKSRDGKRRVVLSESAGEAFISNGGSVIHRCAHPGATLIALSADGSLVATSGWRSDQVKLWDAESGRLIHTWSDSYRAQPFFTPNSRELIISLGDSFTFWDASTFKRKHYIRRSVANFPGYIESFPNGNLMAIEISPGIMELQDAGSRRSIAKLENPFGDRTSWLAFTPDGSELVAVSFYGRAIHIWDLQAIQGQLAAIGLAGGWRVSTEASTLRSPGSRYGGVPLKVTIKQTMPAQR